jgi:hypothetical protein
MHQCYYFGCFHDYGIALFVCLAIKLINIAILLSALENFAIIIAIYAVFARLHFDSFVVLPFYCSACNSIVIGPQLSDIYELGLTAF